MSIKTKQPETKKTPADTKVLAGRPKLRFPGFSGEWREERLGEVCDFQQGVQVDLELQIKNKKEGYKKFLRIENYTQNSQDFRFIPANFSRNGQINIDDVVAVRYGATAGFISRGFSGILANNLFSIKPNDAGEILKDFLYKILKQEKVFKYLQSAMSGGAMPALSFSIMRPIKINFPSIPEQQKIADFLGAVDEWIGNLREQKESLEKYKKGMMQKIFSQEIRFPGFSGEWEEKRLGEVFDNVGGTSLEKFVFENGNYKFISIGNYSKDGKYIDNGQRIILNDKTNTKLLKKNNLAMVLNDKTTSGDIIGSSILIDKDNEYIYNQRTERLICKKNILPLFAWQYLNSKQFRRKIFSIAQGGTQIYVNFPSVKKLDFPIPSTPEQQKIAEFLTSLDNLIESKQQQIGQAEKWKKGLMQGLFV